jgi:hypothetical protein
VALAYWITLGGHQANPHATAAIIITSAGLHLKVKYRSNMPSASYVHTRVARWHIFKPKTQFG